MERKIKIVAVFAVLMVTVSAFEFMYFSRAHTPNLTLSFDAALIQDQQIANIRWVVDSGVVSLNISNVYPHLTVVGWFNLTNDWGTSLELKERDFVTDPIVEIAWDEVAQDCFYIEIAENNKTIATGHVWLYGDFDRIESHQTVSAQFELQFEETVPEGAKYEFTMELVYG